MTKKMNSQHFWREEYAGTFAAKLLLFFLWPFAAWIYSLKSANTKSSFIIFFLFDCLLLWHMAPAGLTEGYHDFLGIMDNFLNTNYTFNDIRYQITAFFSFSDDAPKELYENILIWFVKLFTNNYHFYFLLAVIPVAICQLSVLKRVALDSRFENSIYGLIVLLMIILPRDIIAVQNPRFTTGTWIAICCSISYLCNAHKNLLRLLPIMLIPMIHSGMYFFLAIMLLYLIFPKKARLLEIMALCSIPISFFDVGLLSSFDIVSYLPHNIQSWAERYSSDEYYATFILKEGRSGFWWVDAGTQFAQKIIYFYMTVMMIKYRKVIMNNHEIKDLYLFYLILFTCINIIQFVPVLGQRYWGILRVFCMFLWFKAFFPTHKTLLLVLLASCLWYIVKRYGYILGGALAVNMPPDIYITPLPYLIAKGFLVQ